MQVIDDFLEGLQQRIENSERYRKDNRKKLRGTQVIFWELYLIEFVPLLSSQNCWDTLLSSGPPNAGGQDLVSELR